MHIYINLKIAIFIVNTNKPYVDCLLAKFYYKVLQSQTILTMCSSLYFVLFVLSLNKESGFSTVCYVWQFLLSLDVFFFKFTDTHCLTIMLLLLWNKHDKMFQTTFYQSYPLNLLKQIKHSFLYCISSFQRTCV